MTREPIPATTVKEFMDLRSSRNGRWQLVDGEPRAMVSTPLAHSVMLAKLCRLFGNHLREAGTPGYAIPMAGVVPHLGARYNLRVPDLSITRDGPEGEDRWLTSPMLVVELLGPENHAETWGNIWACSTIPSVEEMLVLQVGQVGADLLRRGADGHWPREPERLAGGDLVLHSIGLRFALAELYGATQQRLTAGSPEAA